MNPLYYPPSIDFDLDERSTWNRSIWRTITIVIRFYTTIYLNIFLYVSVTNNYHFCWWSDVLTLPIRSTDRYFYRSPKRYTWKRNHFTSMYIYIYIYIYIYMYISHENEWHCRWKNTHDEEGRSVARSGDRPLRLAKRSVTDWATDSPTPLVSSKREPRMAERRRGSPILRLVAPKAPIFASLLLQLSCYRPYT